MTRAYPVPFEESQRLEVLRSYQVLDTGPEPEFDQLCDMVARHFCVPIVLVSLVDEYRQWFKARRGLDVCETARDAAFCNYTILDEKVLVVPDAERDPRFANNPYVIGEPHIRFYAGAPLVTPTGFKLGTLCLIDTQPWRAFSPQQAADLKEFAALAMDRIAARNPQPEVAMSAEAEASVRAIEEAHAYLAHELRQPLYAMLGLADAVRLAIEDGQVDAECERYLSRIGRIGKDVCALVDRTLGLGRLSRVGRLGLNLAEEPVALGPFAADLAEVLQSEAEQAGVRLKVEPAPDLVLEADRSKLGQMCRNLILNAIEHTPQGGSVTVSFQYDNGQSNDDANGGGLEIRVTDEGPGMSETEVLRALGPLSRVTDAGSDQGVRLGMGLPLTRRLVEMHGGQLKLRSLHGQGTTALLRFPASRMANLLSAVG